MSRPCLVQRADIGIAEPEQPVQPATGLTQRAYLNVVASLIDYGARIGVALLVTPLMLRGLGPSGYGVWEMLGRLVGYLSAGDGRPTEALRLVIANQQAIDDSPAKRRQVGSAVSVWLIFLPGLAVAGSILIWLSPAITKAPDEQRAVVRWTCTILAANFLLSNLVSLPESVLRGMNLGYRRIGMQAGLWIVNGGLTAGAIYAGLGLPGIACVQVLVTVLTGLLFWAVVKRCVPWFGVSLPSLAEVRSFLGLSLWNFGGTLIAQLLLASDVVILGVITTTVAVTTYVLTGYAAQAATGVLSLTLNAAIPGLSGIIGQKEYGKAACLRDEMMVLSWLAVSAVGATILMWNRSFVHLWVPDGQYAGPWNNLLIVLILAQTIFIRTDAYVIDASLKLRKRVLASACTLLLMIAFTVALTPVLGITGLCLGILSGRMVQTVAYPLLVDSCFGRSPSLRPAQLLRPMLVTACLFAATGLLGDRLLAPTWLAWLVFTSATFCVALAVGLMLGLSSASRRLVFRRLRVLRLRVIT